jgi:hypothetical protein
MQTTTKAGHVTFTHDDQFKGEVTIERSGQAIAVPMDALRKIVAESVRFELADHVQKMKPDALLRRIA